MKKTTLAKLAAIPLFALSSMSYAAESDESVLSEPMQLTAQEMDDVTAGGRGGRSNHGGGRNSFAWLSQINISPVIIIQIGNNNTAIVYSGNFAWLRR